MRSNILSISFFLLSLLVANVANAAWTGDPSAVKITIYGVGVSPNADCSGATGYTITGGREVDFVAGQTIFSQSIADGTYRCVFLLMDARIKVTPATSSPNGICVAGTEYTQAVCRANNGQSFTSTTINSDGTVTYGSKTSCTGTDIIPLFLSTTSTSSGSSVPNAFEQPVASNASNCRNGLATGCGVNIANPFVVAGSTTGTFVVNFTGAVNADEASCGVQAPIFNFR